MTRRKIDIEIYVNYLLIMGSDVDLEIFDGWHFMHGQPCERDAWHRELDRALYDGRTAVTFNGDRFDMRIIELARRGATTQQLKDATDAIIVHKVKPWDITDNPRGIDHIDLIEVAPGQGSLKAYAAKMHSKRLQDLPIEPSAVITQETRLQLREYCMLGDIAATTDLEEAMSAQIQLRVEMSAEYGVELRSKSDAQIAEAVARKLLPFRVQIPRVQYGQTFFYRPPEWLSFVGLNVLRLLERSPFTIGPTGHPMMTKELEETLIRIGSAAYQMGSGGLHSTESKVAYRSDATHVIKIADVRSYYPSLILRTGIEPVQMQGYFQPMYRGWYDTRLQAKDAGNKKRANSLKTLLNGAFGKLASQFSVFYAPAEMIQVTLTGQLALLMLIERLELCGIQVISANTDGIVMRYRREHEWIAAEVVRWWEAVTGMVMETEEWQLLASRDVNSYVALDGKGEPKLKGAYAPPDPGPSGWPNPTGQVCVDAIVAWLRDGVPVQHTIRACTDVRQFIYVRGVKGGGSFLARGVLPKQTTLKAMRELCGDLPKETLLPAYNALVAQRSAERQYLGKVVRWYYAAGSQGCIVTPSDGLVARTEGCKPCMELPEALPADIDFHWYIREAIGMMEDMGLTYNHAGQ